MIKFVECVPGCSGGGCKSLAVGGCRLPPHPPLSLRRHLRLRLACRSACQWPDPARLRSLCVDMKKGRVAKEGLIQYRNACQQVNVASLEEVIKHFLKLATDRAEAAQGASAGASSGLQVVDDLEADTSPEDLMLAYVSAEKGRDRADRELVTPWFKFLWESYRSVLEILRNNSKLEALYAMTAHKAFGFCLQYKRTTEFRRLCEMLRNHLANLIKYRDARDRPDLTQADSLQLYLDTRFEQLKTATELGLWQEAFRSVEDLHGLMTAVKHKPKPAQQAVYYAQLARVFAVSDGCAVYHAAALWRLTALARAYNKNLTPEDGRHLASACVLAALAVPPYEPHARAGAAHAEVEADKERTARMATLLGFGSVSGGPGGGSGHGDGKPGSGGADMLTRAGVLAELRAKGVLALAHPEVRALHDLLEQQTHPLDLCGRAIQLLDALAGVPASLSGAAPLSSCTLTEYRPALERLASLRALHQLGSLYACMRLDALCTAVPFTSWAHTERLLLDACKHGFLQVRLDHQQRCVHFGQPRLEAPGMRDHMAQLVTRLAAAAPKVVSALGTPVPPALAAALPPAGPAARVFDAARVLASIGQEHVRALQRKAAIEKRKEEMEQALQEREREEEHRRAAAQRAAEEAERKRLEEERRHREEARIRQDIEEKELEEARQLLAEQEKRAKEKAAKTGGHGGWAKPPGSLAAAVAAAAGGEGGKLDKRVIMETALQEQIRERQELEKKLAKLARSMDHLERARREEERPLQEAFYKHQAEADAVYAQEQHAAAAEQHKQQWTADLAEKRRLAGAQPDKEAFTQRIDARRTALAAAQAAEREERIAELRAQRREEAQAARRRELLRVLRAADAERRKAAEEQARAERAEADAARREAEREEQARRQQERELAPPPPAGGGGAGGEPPAGRGGTKERRGGGIGWNEVAICGPEAVRGIGGGAGTGEGGREKAGGGRDSFEESRPSPPAHEAGVER